MPRLKYYNPTTEQWENVVVGAQGEQGDSGPANTLTVGTVNDSAPGSTPEVTITGTAPNQTVNFVLPTGDTGPTGAAGATGATGATGPAGPGVAIGGTSGQLLVKASTTNYDTSWQTVESLVPTGTVTQFAGSTAPTGYLLCQGQSLSTTSFANLFGVIGYTYGGSGSSFTLPNLQNRVPVGRGADVEFDTLGETGGAKTHTLTTAEMPSHTHTQNSHNHTQDSHNHTQNSHNHTQNAHNHSFQYQGTSYVGWGYSNGFGGNLSFISGNGISGELTTIANSTATNQATTATNNATTATNQAATATNQNTGGGGAHNNLQPYIVLNYIIKT